MSITFTKLFGNSGAVLGPTLSTNFFESRTWVAPQDGIVIVRGMGAGGGGACGTSATGGYSGSWGAKIVRVKKGDSVQVTIGAPGVGRIGPSQYGTNGNGTAGGDTVVTINGAQYIAYGGPGGVSGGASAPSNGPSPSANWDFGADSVKPGWVASGGTGGAGVDILAQGNNATTSASTSSSGGGGTGSAGADSTGGGAMPGGNSALGDNLANPGIKLDAAYGEWGISFYGGSGSSGIGIGGNGGGGGSGSSPAGSGPGGQGGIGGNGGGGGSGGRGGSSGYSGGGGGTGGIGGGGGGGGQGLGSSSGGNGGNGGQGFAHLKFYADMGV